MCSLREGVKDILFLISDIEICQHPRLKYVFICNLEEGHTTLEPWKDIPAEFLHHSAFRPLVTCGHSVNPESEIN